MIDQPARREEKTLENRLNTTPIAIIGMAAIFPEAENIHEYWGNILNKVDCIRDVPPTRWDVNRYYDPDPSTPDKTYCKRGGFIPDIAFDPLEFGLPPNILEATDVSQLLSLLVAKDAMEDAGYGENREFDRDMTGVILGMVGVGSKLYTPLMARLQYPVWEDALKSYGLTDEETQIVIEKIKSAYAGWEENSFPGTIGNVIAGRIANRLDLGGMNCVVDAACASSLAAVKMAVVELISGRADMMITGGVDTDNSIGAYMCFSKTPAFSKGEHVRPFDADSDGMMVGEGIGMFVLKRLADADRDGDRIYAIIRGVGSSSDGRFKSIYAPRPEGQAKALRRAYLEAGFSPATIGLIEAHGTGTMAGDPAEFQSLNEVFNEANTPRQSVALGSVKSQIAHTKGAAGAASLAKVSLALYHKVLPATINVKRPNPKLNIDNSPFYLNTETRPWIRSATGTPRRAAISSFGFGGTNYHLVLEEHETDLTGPYRVQPTPQAFLLTAATTGELIQSCQAALEKLSLQPETEFINLLHQSKTLDIHPSYPRLGFLAASSSELQEKLEQSLTSITENGNLNAWDTPTGLHFRQSHLNTGGKVVAIFSGQGSQYVDMARELAVNFPPVRETITAMDGLFTSDGLKPLSSYIYPIPAFDQTAKDAQTKALQQTQYAQPAIGVVSAGYFNLLKSAGFDPDFTAGHSFGELTALWAAGALSISDYFQLAKARGQAMAAPDDPGFDAGTMIAVKGDIDQVWQEIRLFPEITLANYNAYNQAVLAGSKPAIAGVKQALTEKGFSVVQLPVSAAFHTPLVGHAREPFARAIQQVQFNPPQRTVFSNTTGQAYPTDPEAIRTILTDHILNPVRWIDEIEAIYAAGGFFFVEFGPKNILTNLVKSILGDRPHLAVALNASTSQDADRQFRETALQLRVAGLPIKDIDPYQAEPHSCKSRKKSPISVSLNGGYFVSEKTRRNHAALLNDGRKIQRLTSSEPSDTRQSASGHTNSHLIPPMTPENSTSKPVQAPQVISPAISPDELNQNLVQLNAHQDETLKVHEQYLANQADTSRAFARLVETGLAGYAKEHGSGSEYLDSFERIIGKFNELQKEANRVHERYLASQQHFTDQIIALIHDTVSPDSAQSAVLHAANHPAAALPPLPNASPTSVQTTSTSHAPISQPDIEQPVDIPAPSMLESIQSSSEANKPTSQPRVNLEEISKSMFQVVSEKTGYPIELLEPGMDMEADLGIDSIKRVEILGAMQAQFPDLPHIEPEALAELRTLGQVINRLSIAIPTDSQDVSKIQPDPSIPEPRANPSPSVPVFTGQVETLTKVMMGIVSEKTGYPTEMISTDMDMEADLGIDSIKRVEILGAMQAQFPDLPQVQPETLADLRTLGQIVDFFTHSPQNTPDPGHSTLKNPDVSVQEEATLPSPGIERSAVRLKPLPPPDHIAFSIPDKAVCLITGNGTSTVPHVARTVKDQGWNPVILDFPPTWVKPDLSLNGEFQHVHLSDSSEAGISQLLDEISAKYGEIGAFIHLDPRHTGEDPTGFSPTTREIIKAVFLMAKYLKEPLNQAALQSRGAFIVVTRLNGNLGLGADLDFDPQIGGLFGLVKSLNLEWDSVFCRAIDLSPELGPDRAAEIIIDELYDPNRLITEVCYGSEGRATLVAASDQ